MHADEDNSMRMRRQLEGSRFVENDKLDHTGNWFVVERDWLEEWHDFTREGSSDTPPGPIPNELLAFADGTPRMVTNSNGELRKLKRTWDYQLVNFLNWRYLHEVYGGGPVLPGVDFERAIAAQQLPASEPPEQQVMEAKQSEPNPTYPKTVTQHAMRALRATCSRHVKLYSIRRYSGPHSDSC